MASSSSLTESSSFESRGSASLNDDSSPEGFVMTYLVEERAAPIYPLNADGFPDLDCAPKGGVIDAVSTLVSEDNHPQPGDRHVFLCFKGPELWPSAASDRLPRFLAAAVKRQRSDMTRNTHLILCEGRDGTEASNGDIMIFPDMIRYRGLTHFDVEAFVDEVLVHDRKWLPGRPEKLFGTHVFVCSQGSRENGFGVSWASLVNTIKEYSSTRGGVLSVKPCSFVQDYSKHSGNMIVYSSNATGEVSGYFYNYVTMDNIYNILDDLNKRGVLDITDRYREAPCPEFEYSALDLLQQSDTAVSLCLNEAYEAHDQSSDLIDGHMQLRTDPCPQFQGPRKNGSKRRHIYASSRWYQASWWLNFWEKEDSLAAFSVVGAAISVALACHMYRTHNSH